MLTFVGDDKLNLVFFIFTVLMGHSSVLSSMDSTSNGLQILKQRKSDARMSRITDLLSVEATLSSANQKELDNLIISDTYDPKSFSESHRGFKTTHNNVFAALGMLVSLLSVCSVCSGEHSEIRMKI